MRRLKVAVAATCLLAEWGTTTTTTRHRGIAVATASELELERMYKKGTKVSVSIPQQPAPSSDPASDRLSKATAGLPLLTKTETPFGAGVDVGDALSAVNGVALARHPLGDYIEALIGDGAPTTLPPGFPADARVVYPLTSPEEDPMVDLASPTGYEVKGYMEVRFVRLSEVNTLSFEPTGPRRDALMAQHLAQQTKAEAAAAAAQAKIDAQRSAEETTAAQAAAAVAAEKAAAEAAITAEEAQAAALAALAAKKQREAQSKEQSRRDARARWKQARLAGEAFEYMFEQVGATNTTAAPTATATTAATTTTTDAAAMATTNAYCYTLDPPLHTLRRRHLRHEHQVRRGQPRARRQPV